MRLGRSALETRQGPELAVEHLLLAAEAGVLVLRRGQGVLHGLALLAALASAPMPNLRSSARQSAPDVDAAEKRSHA